MSGKINCPKCGHQISVDEAIVQRMVDLKVRKTVEEEKNRIEERLKEEILAAEAERAVTLKKSLAEARQKELSALKKQTELEDKLQTQELELARQLQVEKSKINETAAREAAAIWELKLAEKEKQLEDQKKLIGEMQRKAHQGSTQTQGEVLELSLEELLKKHFPEDKIEPVPKGISGADVVQIVYSEGVTPAGKIVWETKRTKNWTEEWVQKLKDDSRTIHADVAILITEALPREMNCFGEYKGVWLGSFAQITGLATAIRAQLIAVSAAVTAETDKDQKMASIYKYVCSNTFVQKVQALVETHDQMKSALESEKRSMIKNWSVRETQIIRLVESTARMYGELKGRIGGALPTIELLELEPPEPPPDKTQSTLL